MTSTLCHALLLVTNRRIREESVAFMDILEELRWRGLMADCTDKESLAERLSRGPITLYCGFDPTADSLHVGHLVPLIALRRFQDMGHHPIAVAGGATGSIGDPSGKSAERQLLSREQLNHNIEQVKQQLACLLDFQASTNPARLVDNASWAGSISFLDFLRDIGKHFTVNVMVAKESVRARMEDREVGISYTEFSYMLLQALDFYHLNKETDCELQIGGTDQWGNITMGIELTRKKSGRQAFGLTLPLITKSDGTKFGKTESGAIWLDPARTSVYRFYQFWIRTDDRDVIAYLKFFTFLSQEVIVQLEKQHLQAPERREAQQALAVAMTDLIHGAEATREAQRASEILFGGDMQGITEQTFAEVLGEVPTSQLSPSCLQGDGLPLADALVEAGLSPSRGQARKDIQGGGANVNNQREPDPKRSLGPEDLLFGKHLLLRKGKKNYAVLSFTAAD